MTQKGITHLCIFIALACLGTIVWLQTAEKPVLPVDEKVEMKENLFGELVPVNQKEPEGLGVAGQILIRGIVFLVIGLYAAAMFIGYVLPKVVNRATREMYGSGAEEENDPFHDARVLFAKGDYVGAIEVYRDAAKKTPDDRFPWVEISKIQNANLEDPEAAIVTLREGLESQEWSVNNAAFFLFRIAELYEKGMEDVMTAIQLLEQVVQLFPETRHAANATHRLRELGVV
ncbi:MAG: tetratricopeptide repeat protein [Akkermansiaceae bacterium]|nr:tetratricopeptide repeat protein [Akkermansiaceae bacterium]